MRDPDSYSQDALELLYEQSTDERGYGIPNPPWLTILIMIFF